MSDKAFFDTNILLYLYSKDEPDKQVISTATVHRYRQPIVSTQVINELINVLHRKLHIGWEAIAVVLTEIEQSFTIEMVTMPIIRVACRIAQRYQYAYYDSTIISSALSNDCAVLISEDMQHGQIVEERLRIINPFV